MQMEYRKVMSGGPPMGFRTNEKGLTLIETIVSLLVFSFVILIFASAMPISGKSAHVNGQYAQAVSLCQHKLDQARAVGFGRLNFTELNDAEIIDSSPSTAPFSFRTIDEVLTYLPNSTATLNLVAVDSKTTRVTATINWKTLPTDQNTRTVTLTALVMDGE
jgi:type II secretory pathway pseudopilin PulG